MESTAMATKRRAKPLNAVIRTGRRAYAKDGVHLFTFLAHRTQKARVRPGRQGGGGAYVNCWINFRLYEGALAVAKFYVRRDGWRVRSVVDHRWINGRPDVPRGSVRYFREAQRDGASLVFYTYPIRRNNSRPLL